MLKQRLSISGEAVACVIFCIEIYYTAKWLIIPKCGGILVEYTRRIWNMRKIKMEFVSEFSEKS